MSKPTLLLALASPALAININLTYDTAGQAGSVPVGDADGSRLMAICQTAADYWEDIIEDSGTLNLQVRYDNGIGGIGKWTEASTGGESGGRPISGIIHFKGTTNWYYDPTPNNHSEYDMRQTLVRDLSVTKRNATFDNNPPLELEVDYMGLAFDTAPVLARTNTDLYSVVLHEMCHALGMSGQLSTCVAETTDGDYDVSPTLANGAVFSVDVNTTGGRHIICDECLMDTGIGPGKRRLPSATDVLALTTCPNPAWTSIDLPRQDFLPGGTSNFNTPGNWVAAQLPGSLDDAWIRHGSLVAMTNSKTIKSLFLGDGSGLSTGPNKLTLNGPLTLEGDNANPTKLILSHNTTAELAAESMTVEGASVTVGTGTTLDLADKLSLLQAPAGPTLPMLTGGGRVEVGNTLRNDGIISASNGNLTFFSTDPNPWDLDGLGSTGRRLEAIDGDLTFENGTLFDNFNGVIEIGPDRTFSFASQFTLGTGGQIIINGGGSPAEESQWADDNSGSLEFASSSELQMGGFADIQAVSTFLPGSSLNILAGSQASFSDEVEFRGNDISIATNAVLRLETESHTTEPVTFSGEGDLYIGNEFDIQADTIVNAHDIDLDGGGAATVFLNKRLTLNVERIDTSGPLNDFGGTMKFSSFFSHLAVNSDAPWTLSGDLDVDYQPTLPLYMSPFTGQDLTISGSANIDGLVNFHVFTELSGTLTFEDAAARLSLRAQAPGKSNKLTGGTVNGPGRLDVGPQASLLGFGNINSGLDGNVTGSIMAENGILSIAGDFSPEGIVGAGPGGILNITSPIDTSTFSELQLKGGTIEGDVINHEGTITSTGLSQLAPSQLVNNGEIHVLNGTLTVDPVNKLRALQATTGFSTFLVDEDASLIFETPGQDKFGGTMTLGKDALVDFKTPLQFGPSTRLTMAGDPGEESTISASNLLLGGEVHLTGHGRFEGSSTIQSHTELTLDADVSIAFNGDLHIQNGASIAGPMGELIIESGFVAIDSGVDINSKLVCGRASVDKAVVLQPAGAGVRGNIALTDLQLTPKANTQFEFSGAEADQITVSGTADLGGTLSLLFDDPPSVGDRWTIMTFGSSVNTFTNLSTTALPADLEAKPIYGPNTLEIAIQPTGGFTFGTWAKFWFADPKDRDPVADPDGDGLPNALEYIFDSNPTISSPEKAPRYTTTEVDGTSYPAFAFDLPTGADYPDATIEVEKSINLVDWNSINILPIPDPENPGALPSLYYLNKPPKSGKIFLRLKVIITL